MAITIVSDAIVNEQALARVFTYRQMVLDIDGTQITAVCNPAQTAADYTTTNKADLYLRAAKLGGGKLKQFRQLNFEGKEIPDVATILNYLSQTDTDLNAASTVAKLQAATKRVHTELKYTIWLLWKILQKVEE